MNHPFTNPYHIEGDYDGRIQRRIAADVPIAVVDQLKSTCPTQGVIQTTINILINKLLTELTKKGITDVTRQDDFKQYVANVIFTDGRDGYEPTGSATAGAVPHAATPPKRTRAKRVVSQGA